MVRGIAMELRDHFPSATLASVLGRRVFALERLLIVLFGVALGNLMRGVPLDANGYFQRDVCVFAQSATRCSLAPLRSSRWRMHGGGVSRLCGWRAGRRARGRALATRWWAVRRTVSRRDASRRSRAHSGFATWLLRRAGRSPLALVALIGARVLGGARAWPSLRSSAFIVASDGRGRGDALSVPASGLSGGQRRHYRSLEAAPSPAALRVALTVTIVGIVAVLRLRRRRLAQAGGKGSRRMRAVGLRRACACRVRSRAAHAVLDRQPFGARSGVWRARARLAQPGR